MSESSSDAGLGSEPDSEATTIGKNDSSVHTLEDSCSISSFFFFLTSDRCC